MKHFTRSIAALACLATTASALVRLEDDTELFITGTLSARHDDNIFLSDIDEVDDTIYEAAPGLKVTFGQGSQMPGSLQLTETFVRYQDNDNLDDELLSAIFGSTYDDSKYRVDVAITHHELNQSTRDVRAATLIRRDVTHAGIDTQISLTDKSSIGIGLKGDDTDYKPTIYSDLQELTIPLNYYYAISEKVDLLSGFRYRDSRVNKSTSGADSTDRYYNIGARGDFTEKFSGLFTIGYNQRKAERRDDETGVGAEAKLEYKVTAKSQVNLSIINDYTTSSEGESQKTFVIAPSFVANLTNQLQATLGLSYQKLEYFSGREDDYLDGRLGLGYRLNENVTFNASYTYRSNDSDIAYTDTRGRARSVDFDNTIITLSAALRF